MRKDARRPGDPTAEALEIGGKTRGLRLDP